MRNRFLVLALVATVCTLALGLNAKASVYDVFSVINNTAYSINNINNATRSTLSTVEYSQRFKDRQDTRSEEQRTKKSYEADAEYEYYKTLQETRQMQNNGNQL